MTSAGARPWLPLVATALVAFARVATADSVVTGPRSVVISTVDDARAAERCRDALEAAIPVYEKHLPYRLPEGEKLVLHLYGTPEEYDAAVVAAGAPALAKRLCATLSRTKESHVVLQPRGEAAYLTLVGGLPEFTRFLVCHEGVHQFLRKAGAPGYDLWPDWYGEGMADSLAEECLKAAAPDGPTPMILSDRKNRVLEDPRAEDLSIARLLHATQFAFEDLGFLYAHAYALYDELAADDVKMQRLHERIRGLGLPGDGPSFAVRQLAHAKACAAALEEVYGPTAALEKAYRERAARAQPPWREQSRSSQRVGDEIVCAGFPGHNALLVSTLDLPAAPVKRTLSCEVNLLDVGFRQADLVLAHQGRKDPRFLKVALVANAYVSLLAFSDGFWQDRFKANADLAPGGIALGTWVAVRIEGDRERIRVDVAGKRVLDAPIPPGFDVLAGTWGLGATDSVARFRKIEVRDDGK